MSSQIPKHLKAYSDIGAYCKKEGLLDSRGLGIHQDLFHEFCPSLDHFKKWATDHGLSEDPYYPVCVERSSRSGYLYLLGFVGMVDYLKVSAMFPGEQVAMPSCVAQSVLDTWKMQDPQGLRELCAKVGLSGVPEQLTETVWESHDPLSMKSIRLAWIGACRLNGINPKRGKNVPDLFYLDTEANEWTSRRNRFSRYKEMGLQLQVGDKAAIVPACSPASLLGAGTLLSSLASPGDRKYLIKDFTVIALCG